MGGKTASKKIKNHKRSKLLNTPTRHRLMLRIQTISSLRWCLIFFVARIHSGAIKRVSKIKKRETPSTPKKKCRLNLGSHGK